MNPTRLILVLFCLVAIAAGIVLTSARAQMPAEWSMGGQNMFDTRNQAAETILNVQNVSGLVPKWVFTTGGDVPVTPAVVGGAVYAPDWQGNFYKIDANTGQAIWSRNVSDYTGRANMYSRTYPAVVGNVVYIGAQGARDGGIETHPTLIAV